MTKQDKNLRSSLIHKINMMFVEVEGRGDYREEAKQIVDGLWNEYKSRLDAPLWLNRMIKEVKTSDSPKLLQYGRN